MDTFTNLLFTLKRDYGATLGRLQREQSQADKEKSEIATLEAAIRLVWDKTHPGEPLPPDALAESVALPQDNSPAMQGGADPISRAKQSILNAIVSAQTRFTTKDIFPSVPEIQNEVVTESFGYDFLRRQVEEGKLWIYQQGAGRRATTYSKEPVDPATEPRNGVFMTAAEGFAPALAALAQMAVKPMTIL